MDNETISQTAALELAEIDQRLTILHSWEESCTQKGKWASLCEVVGGLMMLGSPAGLLTALIEKGCFDLRFYVIFSMVGAAFFTYGWVWRRKNLHGVKAKIQLYEIARLLKRTELDRKFTVSAKISDNRLAIRLHDVKDGPGQHSWGKTIAVDQWGDLFGY